MRADNFESSARHNFLRKTLRETALCSCDDCWCSLLLLFEVP